MERLERFHLVAGLVLDDALNGFPDYKPIDTIRIVETISGEKYPAQEYNPISGTLEPALSEHQEEIRSLCDSTISWLVDEGYLRGSSVASNIVVLTSKGQAVLGIRPLDEPDEPTFAEKLRSNVAQGAWSAVADSTKLLLLSGAGGALGF
ncbi:hypothetical protein HPA02_03050 [Bisbaumannia pacifica]|uniref:Uncharacterized protein n=1 Tax=Bisbaumannia pacifica TaxID=77098 RepID=A0A510X3M6_9GAMM|nr:hypothetical protein [Halomonas pacifica]GEK46022.1 hypothetical protein HPA02_03050 [Halomonas pacifica]